MNAVKRRPPSEGRGVQAVKAASGETKTLAVGHPDGKFVGVSLSLPLLIMKTLYASPRAVLAVVGLFVTTASLSAAEPKAAVNDGSLDQHIKLSKAVRPLYPSFMRRAGLIGSVTIDFVVDTNGQVINPYVIESNNPWFERPVIDAILQWKFQPALQAGHPVNVEARQIFEFTLENGEVPELWTVTKSKEQDKLPLALQWDTPPTPVSTMFPVYPLEQLQTDVEGRVRISYIVGPDGRVVAAKPLEATTPEFGLAVLAMIDAWRFHPAKKKDGTLAYAKLTTEYAFRTNGRGDVPVSEEAQRILKDIKKRPESIVALKDLDQPPKPLSRRPPVYPTALEKAGQPGQAMIEFFIDYKGDVQLPRIVSATAPEFGYAAAQAVATWRFEPPMQKGKKVIARVKIPVDFKVYERRTDGTAEKIPEFPEPRP